MKIFPIIVLLLLSFSISAKAQYGTLLRTLERIEKRRGALQKPISIDFNNKKFVFISDGQDHTKRNILSFNGEQCTLIEVLDDKKTGKSTSEIFVGDYIKTNKNILSIRLHTQEKEKLSIPITKNFLLNQQEDIYYLIEVNTQYRWIDEFAIQKHREKNKK